MKNWLNDRIDKYATIELSINASKIGTVIHKPAMNSAIGGYLVAQSGMDLVKSLIYVDIEKYDGQDELFWLLVKDASFDAG